MLTFRRLACKADVPLATTTCRRRREPAVGIAQPRALSRWRGRRAGRCRSPSSQVFPLREPQQLAGAQSTRLEGRHAAGQQAWAIPHAPSVSPAPLLPPAPKSHLKALACAAGKRPALPGPASRSLGDRCPTISWWSRTLGSSHLLWPLAVRKTDELGVQDVNKGQESLWPC